MSNADYIVEQIKNRFICPPDNLTADELQMYLCGYAQCQKDIINLIQDMTVMKQ